jgi:hypothetical protein
MEPYVGMRFDSLQVAKDHYKLCPTDGFLYQDEHLETDTSYK